MMDCNFILVALAVCHRDKNLVVIILPEVFGSPFV